MCAMHSGKSPRQDVLDTAEQSHRVLRTVFLPAANADAIRLKVESLQAQLAEHKQLSSERVEALKQDRQLREQVSNTGAAAAIMRLKAYPQACTM